MNSQKSKSERGIALIIVLFSLLLLSVIGLGMMYSTNMETSINSNYRDKQVAFYAALAGLQEARDRIQPATHNIVAPTALPSTSAAYIAYIVANYATVKPWDNTNAYFDTELCQEKVLGLTATLGVPCAGPYPTGSPLWYSYVDDSLSASAPWNLTTPLDLKWTRIELKGNNATPVAVNGNSNDPSQTCWTGAVQMSTPTGYSTGCQPIGGVTAVTVITSGTGYTATGPTVGLSGGGGTGAAATVVMAPETTGVVSAVTLTGGGSGYSVAPTVVFVGAGTGATATAVLSATGTPNTTGGYVSSISMTTGGAGYSTAPTVSFGGPGAGATATAVLSTSGTTTHAGYVDTITLTAGGSGYTVAPTVNFSTGNATATATLGTSGIVETINVTNVGSQCYHQASDVVIAFSGGGGSGAAATATLEAGRSCVYSVTVPSSPQCTTKLTTGNGYNPADQASGISITAGNRSFSGTLFVSGANDKTPSSFSVQNPGYDAAGYSAASVGPSLLELTSGAWANGCGNASATVTTGYRISTITMTSNGTGYSSLPTVCISGGVGTTGGSTPTAGCPNVTSNPTATAVLGYPITALTLTSPGNGYANAPTVSFSGGGGGAGAAATATIVQNNTTTYPVAYITLNSGGSGYTTAPSVTLSGGGGAGAAATAAVTLTSTYTYPVASITLNSGGTGYDPANPPAVSLIGGGGTGATATATVASMNTGTYYVSAINVTTPPSGTGYTSDPTVTLTGGGGSGATALATVSGGTKYGSVWLLTSFAQTKTGARAMLQEEVATPVMGFALGGALTLDGPNPAIDAMPNSNNFRIQGNDADSCGGTAEPLHPAIDGYDDPNANPPTNSVTDITNSLPRPDHYTGAGGTPSVQNGYAALGETMTTPTGLLAVISAIYNAPGAHHWDSSNVGSFNVGSTTTSSINYVDGNLSTGPSTGNGILVVTGTLTMSGNFGWNGLIFVVGDGNVQNSGGGNGQIVGSIFVAKIWDGYMTKNLLSALGTPTFHWNGGGGNGVQYDHCLASNLMTAIPPINYVSTKPLKILSFRILPY